MYDRAPRPLTQPFTSTPPAIGPGVYHSSKRTSNSGFAPFSSLSKRQSFLTISEQLIATPGPGHYQLGSTQADRIKGGESLQSKTSRFPISPPQTPGPGTYNVSTSTPAVHNEGMVKGKIAVCNGRVLYQRQSTAPSIPIPGLNCGYEQTESGQLKPQELPDRDNTIGPAYYNTFQEDSATGMKYKGIDFGNLKSSRRSFIGKEGPGPGEYDPQPSHDRQSIAAQSGTANLPRYHELMAYEGNKKGVPGPGKYNLPSQFNSASDGVDGAVKPAFGSSLMRFVSVTSCSPPCTKYSDPQTAFSCLKRISGLSRSPFGQTASRFKESRSAMEVPGPGAYNNSDVTSISTRALTKSILLGLKQPIFGSSAMRTAPLAKVDAHTYPGPSDYHVDERPSQRIKPTAAFASCTKRFYSPTTSVADMPSTRLFDESESFSKSQDKKSKHAAELSTLPSQSLASVTSPRDLFLRQPDIDNPGPGQYEPDKLFCIGTQRRGLICGQEERFKICPVSALGPGTYNMSKAFMDTVLKGTHNVTLRNPLIIEDEQHSKVVSHQVLPENNKAVLLTT